MLAVSQRGFTLVELIMGLIILAVLAVFAAPRFFDADVFESHGAAEQVKAALRYGQKIAIAQRRTINVVVSAASVSSCGAQLVAGNVSCVISSRVATSGIPATLAFDALGRPVPNVATSLVVGGVAIAIEMETGYVH